MALNLTDNWQMAKIFNDNWHLYPSIQTLLVPRWLEWRRLTMDILWDKEGKWPEVRKSRACSRECWSFDRYEDCTTRNPVIHAILFKQIDGYKMFLEIFVICCFIRRNIVWS